MPPERSAWPLQRDEAKKFDFLSKSRVPDSVQYCHKITQGVIQPYWLSVENKRICT